jgi:hypothetical protein
VNVGFMRPKQAPALCCGEVGCTLGPPPTTPLPPSVGLAGEREIPHPAALPIPHSFTPTSPVLNIGLALT